jgi:hypothetical protein
MVFLLGWIFSGWLSMDHGRLFSTGLPDNADLRRYHGRLDPPATMPLVQSLREIEWFSLGGVTLALSIDTRGTRSVFDEGSAVDIVALSRIDAAVRVVDARCTEVTRVAPDDPQRGTYATPRTTLVRAICAKRWLHVDASNGQLIETLDTSRRAYQYLYLTLHTLDFPVLRRHPEVRSALIVGLCAIGCVFSVTAVVLGWRRIARFRNR